MLPTKKLGFTLIELLIVIGLTVGLSGLIIPQFSKFNSLQTLNDEANNLQSNLRKAQANAQAGTKCNDTLAASDWYLKFTSSSGASGYSVGSTCIDGSKVDSRIRNMPASVSIFVQNPTSIDTCSDINNHTIGFSNVSGAVNFQTTSAAPCNYIFTGKEVLVLKNVVSGISIDVVVEKGGAIYVR